VHVLERSRDLDRALDTFRWFWHPHHVEEITGAPIPPDGWGRGHTYGRLLTRGCKLIREYWDLVRYDESELLGLEYEFIVPIPGTEHHLAGTIDRLSARWRKRQLLLDVGDFKTGRVKWGLRWNMQGTAYCMATEQESFWTGFVGEIDGLHFDTRGESFGERGEALRERFAVTPRGFTWIDLSGQSVEVKDGGTRGPQDYQRFADAANDFVRAVQAGIFPLRMDGETCGVCPVADVCGLPSE
jgi:hypothetical protein